MSKTDQAVERLPYADHINLIDIFRGLTIFIMIFVNDVARIDGVPWWMKHMPGNVNGMTFVDVVFPAFLFIVGMVVPVVIDKRLSEGLPRAAIWSRILTRSFSLLVVGVYMMNASDIQPAATGMSSDVWKLLLFAGVMLIWNQYPYVRDKAWLATVSHLSGIGILVFLAVIFRGNADGNTIWLRTAWWGILGLIGWAYLFTCAAYLLCKRLKGKQVVAMSGILGLFILIKVCEQRGMIPRLDIIPGAVYIYLGRHIAAPATASIAGAIVSMMMFSKSSLTNIPKRISAVLLFAAGLLILGSILQPYGISKTDSTPTWLLYSSSICCVIFVLLFLLEIKVSMGKWKLLLSVGKNPMLAYILPPLCIQPLFAILGIGGYPGGVLNGIFMSLVFTVAVTVLSGLLHERGVSLRL